MSNRENLWQGLRPAARAALSTRDYRAGTFAQQLAGAGVEAQELVAADRNRPEIAQSWIPGVEVFPRKIYPQRHRGSFGELGRCDEGVLGEIGLWPKQWAAARMFAQTAKGFHVHPPSIPQGTTAAGWIQRLFVDEPRNYSLRPYQEEQWDVMFIVQGVVEMILCDLREGMASRIMRLLIDGDNRRSPNNVAVVIPPGVAHAIRTESSEDAIMVYGTSTTFQPECEGRIAAEVETAPLPATWQKFLSSLDAP